MNSKTIKPAPGKSLKQSTKASNKWKWLTEARVALTLSIFALVAAMWQAVESYRANQIARESLIVYAEKTNLSNERIVDAACTTPWPKSDTSSGNVWIDLQWKVTIFNGSSLPIAMKSLDISGETPAGKASMWTVGPQGRMDWPQPVVLPARDWAAYYVIAHSSPSNEFFEWFIRNGGCEGRIDWKDNEVRRKAGFFEGGWKEPGQVHLVVAVTTGTGEKFTSRSTWEDNPSTFAPPDPLDTAELSEPPAPPVIRAVPR
jgi:hypothetical protein